MPCTIDHYFIWSCWAIFFHPDSIAGGIACLPFSFEWIQRVEKKNARPKHKRIRLLIAMHCCCIMLLVCNEIASSVQNNKQNSQYNFNKVNALIFKSLCSIKPLKWVLLQFFFRWEKNSRYWFLTLGKNSTVFDHWNFRISMAKKWPL